jgi:hypothetical protein
MTRATDAWAALRGHPVRFLRSAWPWRSLAYVVTSVPIGLVALLVLATTLMIGAVTLVVVVGLAVLAAIPVLTGLLGVVERRRLALVRPGRRTERRWSSGCAPAVGCRCRGRRSGTPSSSAVCSGWSTVRR